MPLRQWVKSANFAIEGILHAAKTQRHLRYHLYATILILVLSFILGIDRADFIVIVILSMIILSLEMLNTALEVLADYLFKEFDHRARAIKDVAAGAVLMVALGAAVIGYIILFEPLRDAFYNGLTIATHAKGDVAVISLVIVLILVVLTKAFLGKGHPLKGGMPSGHAAVSFSVWVAVTLISESFVPSLLVFLLAIAVAQSRVSTGIHRPIEVVLGAMLGSIVTYLLFRLFS